MRVAALVTALMLASCSQPKPAEAPKPVYFTVDFATAARVTGTAVFTGKPPASKRITMDAEPDCARLHSEPVYDRRVSTGKGGTLANVFVYVKRGLEGKTFAPPTTAVTIDQRGCQFLPRVIAARTAQTITVRNSDPVSHNIHPEPKNNRDWNQQQTPGAPDLQRRFGFPEVMIPVKCNIHNWMRSWIAVLDHPYFAVTSVDGAWTLDPLPPGRYTLAAWHEAYGELTREVTLDARQTVPVEFRFAAQ